MEASLPDPIRTQLQVILQSDAEADCVALVWPQTLEPTESMHRISDTAMRLVYCPSELAMREQLVQHQHGDTRLVLLSPFDETRLGKDVLARLWKTEPKRISPWRTLQQLLKVTQIDPRLTRKGYRWIAECLLSSYDRYASHITFGEVLDFERAWQAVALGLLDYREASVDIESLLSWSLTPSAGQRVEQLPAEVRSHLGDWLEPRLQHQAPLVQRLWEHGHAGRMFAIALVCALVYRNEQEPSQAILQARGQLTERYFGGARIDSDALRRFGLAAVDCAVRADAAAEGQDLSAALAHAEQILATVDLTALAVESDLLPIAFTQRLDHLAQALEVAAGGKSLAPARRALAAVRRHRLAGVRTGQVATAEHAVRTCAWLQTPEKHSSDARSMLQDYVRNGGFVDWSRSRLWSGDEHEALSRAYALITSKASARREQINEQFSHCLPAVARGDKLGSAALPVERALDELVAPLAKQQPVLLLVLDGMSQAVYRELTADLLRYGWVELQRYEVDDASCLLATLPSITRASRYSLLAGALGEGVSADEKKAFASHPALKALAATRHPPRLFHKSELQQVGSGGLSNNVREAIAGSEHRVLAAVINAVDDQLSSNAQITINWSVESVSLLRQILEAARDSGRAIILTSDHGHVLDHDMEYVASSSDAERFRAASGDIAPGEVLLEGQRVMQPEQRVIVPWSETIRYAQKKMGYHGGGSLQEVAIPVGVFRNASDTSDIEGWHEAPRFTPDWWALQSDDVGESEDAPAAPVPTTRSSKKDDRTIDFLDQSKPAAGTTKAEPDWLRRVCESPVYQQMKSRAGRASIEDDRLIRLLLILAQRGGQQMLPALAQKLGIPALRINGFLAGAQRLLNVDGYSVLSIERETKTARLNIDLLKKQFEL